MVTKTTPTSPPTNLPPAVLLNALRAFRRGDFSKRLPDGLSGIDGQIAEQFNEILELVGNLVEDVTNVGEAVGHQGKIKKRLSKAGLRGDWETYTESVNTMLDGLTQHSAEMARVVASVSKGDLTQVIDLQGDGQPLAGDFLRYGRMVNTMVEQLAAFGSEVTRVARDVGVEGKLGSQATVKGVSGTWKELTDNVNLMADNLTNQMRDIAQVTTAVAQGDLSRKVTVEVRGEIMELKNTINSMVDQLGSFADEVTRVAREVGTEGVLGGQAQVKGVAGTWRELTENVNSMANNLTGQVRNIAEVATAIAYGDLTKKITVDAKGEIQTLKDTINIMVEQLGSFADEVTRVAREVGSEGKLGGQADVKGVSGTWKDLTENVNSMANNLTGQVRNIAEVATAIAYGDLTKKITVDAKGEIQTLKDTINTMVDKLQGFSAEVTRVARLVGTEGTLGVEAEVQDVSGVWKELTDNVNQMATNLTSQVRNIAEVTTAVANGDLSRKITVEVKGEILQLKETINQMVDSLNAFASEVTRMAKDVGTDGVLGGQATVRDISGIWKELTDNVNQMANNLTSQVRNIAEVSTAVAAGDMSKKITVDARGEILDLKNTVNTMVDQLNSFGAEVTRLAKDVGLEGKLGGQAEIPGVQGLWKELTDNVNLMASNLTEQVRDIAEVTTAVANGDLTKKSMVDAKGEIQELKNTVNTMVDQLSSFASEVTRLAKDVGLEGILGGQADVRGVSGTWRDLTDNVNLMASNLTDQVRNISQVTSAVAQGDLEKYIVVDAKGEIMVLKETINTMVGQLRSFAEEVTRVSREVGTEGKLGGQADVKGVSGTWRALTDNVNQMADNLTSQVRDIAQVTTAVAQGDLTKKISVEVKGEILDLKNTINTMVEQLGSFAEEVTRVARDVGVEGKLGGQADVRGVAGTWRELTDNVNLMASNLTNQVRDIATVTTAVAQGDLSRKIKVVVRGEILELTETINTMVDQLSSFADEVTRVAREVGTEGKLGGQAQVRGVSGIWQELTGNVNTMASNLTEQVRGIALVVTAVANGDLQQQLTMNAKGEIATLVDTINNMIVILSLFADQVTGVARDVGVEGKLGGQADVPNAAGIWRDLTNNVNELAGNLTNQVRAIGEVATAVTEGDLSRTITVEARGEVALLKDNINQMIATLGLTTKVNQDQDWLKTNLAKFTRMLQGQRDLMSVARQVLSELAPVADIHHGVFYIVEKVGDQTFLKLHAAYAYKERKMVGNRFALGEGLVGQCAIEKQRILLTDVPDDYIQVNSGLGSGAPLNIVVVPIVYEGEVKGVVELASFTRFSEIRLGFLEQLFESMGIVVATIESNMRTDELLRQSQGLTEELQNQQEELQQTNEELEEKAKQLSEQKTEVERKNREVEEAKSSLEEKAEQLSLTSKYKSEFLANMSHELRTPLNSLLILSQQLAENIDTNLSDRQVESARTIHASGNDLLSLINEVLDLAKIESGTMSVEVDNVRFESLAEFSRRGFNQVATGKGLKFDVNLDKALPAAIRTDGKRLQQVLRNLLSNAFKFTEKGRVKLTIALARERSWSIGNDLLDKAKKVVIFTVEDTGIGIPQDRQKLIFEAFQQADGSTSRKYGGTGLGLSISREIASLLGGEIRLKSSPGDGSCFMFYLPLDYIIPPTPRRISGQSETTNFRKPAFRELAPIEHNADDIIDQSIDDSVDNSLDSLVDSSGVAELELLSAAMEDDRNNIAEGDRVLLVIEDDEIFADLLMQHARKQGFNVLVAVTGHQGLALAQNYVPDAITLDLNLPDMHGFVVLDRLKHNPSTRHIPVHVMSVEDAEDRSLSYGAIDFLAKPTDIEGLEQAIERISKFIDKKVKQLLVVEDDKTQRESIVQLIGNSDVKTTAVATGKAALAALKKQPFDCMVLDLSLPDMTGFALIHTIRKQPALMKLPVIVYTGRELTPAQETELKELTETIIVKDVKSPERLLDETALFLHRLESRLPEHKQRMIRQLYHSDPVLVGRKVLIVDDDVRNIFAITSLLEQHKIIVIRAEDGKEGLACLQDNPDVDAVLMDIMMPEMDGYEAIRRIRRIKRFKDLPVIALTAKAMKGDREKCIDVGASEYVTKPIDTEQLLSLLRVWIAK